MITLNKIRNLISRKILFIFLLAIIQFENKLQSNPIGVILDRLPVALGTIEELLAIAGIFYLGAQCDDGYIEVPIDTSKLDEELKANIVPAKKSDPNTFIIKNEKTFLPYSSETNIKATQKKALIIKLSKVIQESATDIEKDTSKIDAIPTSSSEVANLPKTEKPVLRIPKNVFAQTIIAMPKEEQVAFFDKLIDSINLEVKAIQNRNTTLVKISTKIGQGSKVNSPIRAVLGMLDECLPGKKEELFRSEVIMRNLTEKELLIEDKKSDERKRFNPQFAKEYFAYIDETLNHIHNLTNKKADLTDRVYAVSYLLDLVVNNQLVLGSTRTYFRDVILRILDLYFDENGNLDLNRKIPSGQITSLYSHLIHLLSTDKALNKVYKNYPYFYDEVGYSFLNFDSQIEKAQQNGVPGMYGDLKQEAKIKLKDFKTIDLKKVVNSRDNRRIAHLGNLMISFKVNEAKKFLDSTPANSKLKKTLTTIFDSLYEKCLERKGLSEYKNDPYWNNLNLKEKQDYLTDIEKIQPLIKELKTRDTLKRLIEKIYDLPTNYSTDIEQFIYKFISQRKNPDAQYKLLMDIAKNRNSNSELYDAFFAKNGILKVYKNTDFIINSRHSDELQYKLIELVNKTFATLPTESNKVVIENIQKYLYLAAESNDSEIAKTYLYLANATHKALQGNKFYEPLLDKDLLPFCTTKKEILELIDDEEIEQIIINEFLTEECGLDLGSDKKLNGECLPENKQPVKSCGDKIFDDISDFGCGNLIDDQETNLPNIGCESEEELKTPECNWSKGVANLISLKDDAVYPPAYIALVPGDDKTPDGQAKLKPVLVVPVETDKSIEDIKIFNGSEHSELVKKTIEEVKELIEEFNDQKFKVIVNGKEITLLINPEILVHHVSHGHFDAKHKKLTGYHMIDKNGKDCCFEFIEEIKAEDGSMIGRITAVDPELKQTYKDGLNKTVFGSNWDHAKVIRELIDALKKNRIKESIKRGSEYILRFEADQTMIEVKIYSGGEIYNYYPEIRWVRENILNKKG